MYAIGVDIGGTKISAAAVDGEGRLSRIQQVPSRASEGPHAVFQQCFLAIHSVLAHFRAASILGIGVASAGRIDPLTGVVLFSTNTFFHWRGATIAHHIQNEFGMLVFVENDVNAALLGEVWTGSARGVKRAAFLALGTGVGGALLEKGQVANGFHCSAGEFGHMIFSAGGRSCGCGARGCYEAYLAGPALAADYTELSGRACTGEDVMEAFAAGDMLAIKVVKSWASALAALLYTLQNSFDPEICVIGGGIVDSASVWWGELLNAMSAYPLSVAVVAAMHGNQAAIVGAARLVFAQSSNQDQKESDGM